MQLQTLLLIIHVSISHQPQPRPPPPPYPPHWPNWAASVARDLVLPEWLKLSTAQATSLIGPEWLALRHRIEGRAQTVAARLALARATQPASSLEELEQRCPALKSQTLNVLRVPKTGSTTVLNSLEERDEIDNGSCNVDFDLIGGHELLPSETCTAPSLVGLREPCERFVSIYHHLQGAYRSLGWLKAYTVNDFIPVFRRAQLLAIRGHPHIAREHAEEKPYDPLRPQDSPWPLWRGPHEIVALPQALWVGNASVALCMPTLDTEIPKVLRWMGCSAARVKEALKQVRWNVGVNESTDARHTLSVEGCRQVREELFPEDTELWERMCAKRVRAARDRARSA